MTNNFYKQLICKLHDVYVRKYRYLIWKTIWKRRRLQKRVFTYTNVTQ